MLAIWSWYELSRPLNSNSFYKIKGQNWIGKFIEIFSWGRPANCNTKIKVLQEISLISFLLRAIIISVVRNRPELIKASQICLFSLALAKSNLNFFITITWNSSKWLKINSRVKNIVLFSENWRSWLFYPCFLDDGEK